MIHVFAGENGFAVNEALAALLAAHDGDVQRLDGSDVRIGDLPEITCGATLFASKRLVIIDELSSAKDTWAALIDWIDRVDEATTLVLLEQKPDKRLTTYKELVKRGVVQEFPVWDGASRGRAANWTKEHAAANSLTLSQAQAQTIADRLQWDQWRVHHAIEKLAPLGSVSDEQLNEMIETSPHENVFELLAAALKKDHAQVEQTISVLAQTDDPYRVMGLLSSQALQLSALVLSDTNSSDVARDIKQSPYALRNLERVKPLLTKQQAVDLIDECAKVDHDMKSTGVEPWLLIKQFLLKLA